MEEISTVEKKTLFIVLCIFGQKTGMCYYTSQLKLAISLVYIILYGDVSDFIHLISVLSIFQNDYAILLKVLRPYSRRI